MKRDFLLTHRLFTHGLFTHGLFKQGWLLSFALVLSACGGGGSTGKDADSVPKSSVTSSISSASSLTSSAGISSVSSNSVASMSNASSLSSMKSSQSSLVSSTSSVSSLIGRSSSALSLSSSMSSVKSSATSSSKSSSNSSMVSSSSLSSRSSSSLASSASSSSVQPPNPSEIGQWIDVTPSNVDMVNRLSCDSYGIGTVQVDPLKPSDLYLVADCQGIWKSVDYGKTWQGPINTGKNGALAGDCAGGIAIGAGTPGQPVIYLSCIRGSALSFAGFGFWKSTDGGVSWTGYTVGPGTNYPTGNRQDFYAPAVDPYDPKHLIMAGHEMNLLVESIDGGETWTEIKQDAGMTQNGGTAAIFFIDRGEPANTRKTFLWLAQHTGGFIGTWRTVDGGKNWSHVDNNEHAHGGSQIYQPDGNGVVYMGGAYSNLGWGVLRSQDYGQSWTHVGNFSNTGTVFGTPKFVYATTGGTASGLGATLEPSFELGAQPGTGTWVQPGTPATMKLGPGQVTVTNDGKNNILLGATGGSGVWRYVEP